MLYALNPPLNILLSLLKLFYASLSLKLSLLCRPMSQGDHIKEREG